MGKIWATIDRFEEDKAVLILPGNQQLTVDRENLPLGLKEGDRVAIDFSTNAKETEKQVKKTRKILSQLLTKK